MLLVSDCGLKNGVRFLLMEVKTSKLKYTIILKIDFYNKFNVIGVRLMKYHDFFIIKNHLCKLILFSGVYTRTVQENLF